MLDGFIGLVRENMQEQELLQETETQINEETKGFTADGHFGTWHTAEVQEINGERFYRMEHDEYGNSVASIIVNQDGKLVAEDLEHGFDQGVMEAIFSDAGVPVVVCKSMDGKELQEQRKAEEKITFYVAECTEFPAMGEYHECLGTLQEAMELYEKIPAERMNGMKGIGFRLENGSAFDGDFELMVAGEIQEALINEIPQYRESPLVQKAVADMKEILHGQKERSTLEEKAKPERRKPQQQPEKPFPKSQKGEGAPKTGQNASGISKKQSVLNALRERQERMKAQEKEKQGQKPKAHRKGEQEI